MRRAATYTLGNDIVSLLCHEVVKCVRPCLSDAQTRKGSIGVDLELVVKVRWIWPTDESISDLAVRHKLVSVACRNQVSLDIGLCSFPKQCSNRADG